MRRLAAAVCLLAGCAPTYAPPVRAIHGGAPRPALESFQIDAADADGVVPGVAARIPLAGHLAAELGGDVAADFAPDLAASWKMGHAGLRATTGLGDAGDPRRLAADLELGGGVGSGGAFAVAGDDTSTTSNALAWGGYLGAGVGGHGQLLGLYARTLVELAASRDDAIPLTRWGSLVGGIQMGSGGGPRVRLAAGLAVHDNRDELRAAPIVEIGLELGGGPPAPPLPERPPARWHRFRRQRLHHR